jgi:hypothetical protein
MNVPAYTAQTYACTLLLKIVSNTPSSSRIKTFAELNNLSSLSYAYSAFVMAADLMIAACLTFLLQRARLRPRERSNDPFKARMDGAVQRLVSVSRNSP